MRKIFRGVGLSILFICCAGTVSAATTLTGNYLKVGVSDSGALIDFATGTGVKYDPSGRGDFAGVNDILMPGLPFAFYSIGVNGQSATASSLLRNNPFSSVTAGSSVGGTQFAVTAGGNYGGLSITQVLSFGVNSSTLHSSIVLTNTSNYTMHSVAYAVGLDPDQDATGQKGFETTNVVQGHGPESSVWAYGRKSDIWVTLSSTSGWEKTRAGISSDWITDPYSLIYMPRNDGSGDNSISLAYNLGELRPGEQVSLGYDYAFARAVPEPETYAMLGMGLGLIGLMRMRSRQQG